MDLIYKLLKLNRLVKNYRIKFAGLIVARFLRIRHLSLRIDPMIACNLMCLMCPVSKGRAKKIEKFTESDIVRLAKLLFPRALQVVIGCGYEPTVYKNFMDIVKLARAYKVPYVGFTSNGQLLTSEHIGQFIHYGLNELTLSLHGVKKETYENLMVNASYNKFHDLLNLLDSIKKSKKTPFPHLRLNYTVNSQNIDELLNFFDVYGKYGIKTLQVRPMFGNMYPEGKLSTADIDKYRKVVNTLSQECVKRNITLLANVRDEKFQGENYAAIIFPEVYYYINPNIVWRQDFNWKKETYEEFCRRVAYTRYLISSIFLGKETLLKRADKLAGTGRYDVF